MAEFVEEAKRSSSSGPRTPCCGLGLPHLSCSVDGQILSYLTAFLVDFGIAQDGLSKPAAPRIFSIAEVSQCDDYTQLQIQTSVRVIYSIYLEFHGGTGVLQV